MLKQLKELCRKNGEIYLRIKVRPNAAKTCVKEIMSDKTVKIDLEAAPVKGKANQELIKFLAQQFDAVNCNVKIVSGAGDRVKLIKIIK
ncbi:YggU family protein [Patescibacteria group bacterium]|nr:YggU family protein [Patescibacteria group bacterium]MBU1663501.1 YggU family protein [Patescibacteria group bacterium]MBU1933929.1 YggU family protein [Patescibacteria group bacterium]MBU2007735.1 YggU family protein [Patescibacteria group bacterium]